MIDIKCLNIISIISGYLEYLLNIESNYNCNYKINSKNCIEILMNKLLYLMLYSKKSNISNAK